MPIRLERWDDIDRDAIAREFSKRLDEELRKITQRGEPMNKVLKKDGDQLPTTAEIDEFLSANRGAGVSNKAADVIIPQIVCLNPSSPQVGNGAAAGDFLVGERVVAASPGILFQPCGVRQLWLEFNPLTKGGGFVGAYPWDGVENPPEGAVARGANQNQLTFDNGNNVMHYRHVVGLLWEDKVGLEYILPFHSSGHTVARKWMAEIGRRGRTANGGQDPIYGCVWRITSERYTNNMGTWYLPKILEPVSFRDVKVEEIVGDDRMAALKMAKELNEAFEGSTDVVAAMPQRREGAGEDPSL